MAATYRFALHFAGGDVRQGQVPGAVAQIRLQNWTEDDDGTIFVSAQCMGPTELLHQVNRLKEELDEILRRGKRRFKDYQSETLKAIREKQKA